MKIVKITKTGLFYKVKFDNDMVHKFHESIIISYGLIRKNIEISEEKLSKALVENEYYIALDKGINYLTTLHCRKEVLLYLRKHYDKELADKVLLQLEKLKLINDKEYAFIVVEVMKRKLYGVNKIINELKALEINEEYIFEALNNYSEDEELDNCDKVLLKYLPSLKKESRQGSIKKVTNYLISRGFSNSIITKAIENNQEKLDNISNEDELLIKMYNKLLRTKKDNIEEKKFKNKVIRSLTSKGFPLYKVLKVLDGEISYDKK